jgi:ribosomal protein S18 acetylase RimI-like enzyme
MRYEGGAPSLERVGLRIEELDREWMGELVELRKDEFGGSREDTERFEEAVFASPGRRQFGALLEGRLIGACSLGFEGSRVSINGVVIDRTHRGRGYCQALLGEVLARLSGQDLEIVLDVDSLNANALHIYRKLGFTPTCAIEYHRRPLPRRVGV